MMKFINMLIVGSLGLSPVLPENEKEIWISHPSISQVENTSLWCYSNVVKSSLGKTKHFFYFGYKIKNKDSSKITSVIKLPVRDGVIYSWSLDGDYLVIKDTGNNKIIITLDVNAFEKK